MDAANEIEEIAMIKAQQAYPIRTRTDMDGDVYDANSGRRIAYAKAYVDGIIQGLSHISNKKINGIPASRYNFLLDWKDKNVEQFVAIKGVVSLSTLSAYELNKLYEAIQSDNKPVD